MKVRKGVVGSFDNRRKERNEKKFSIFDENYLGIRARKKKEVVLRTHALPDKNSIRFWQFQNIMKMLSDCTRIGKY